ncbi:hypothetical protein [Lacipirellula parvula]|uniref:Uncharacterized protein n=1 Tax=Lacipirellula parvula TaxID=2650471 RepID=A0A5K7XFF8_9BACT|nr:hypothetical protein [Lacipirellula parvula]BBO35540.1 hypothetical protein PLANPX_5152 [Lacipirellula parvula]
MHPFKIFIDGDLVSAVSDTAILFTRIPTAEAVERLSKHISIAEVDDLFANYDGGTEFRRIYFQLKKGT